MRNTTGATLIGIGIFGGIPTTLYALSNLGIGAGLVAALGTGIVLWIGHTSESQENARGREDTHQG